MIFIHVCYVSSHVVIIFGMKAYFSAVCREFYTSASGFMSFSEK